MKKTIVFFDVDGTLFDHSTKQVHPDTVLAIKALANNRDVELALATGRSLGALHVINDILPYFSIKVLLNGAFALHHNNVIFSAPLPIDDIKSLHAYAEKHQLALGFVSSHDEAISQINETVVKAIDNFDMPMPVMDPFYYTHKPVFQMWAFSEESHHIDALKSTFPRLRFMSWHANGCDITSPVHNKGTTIKAITEGKYEQVIAFGDGENDLEMLEMVDFGVAMGNAYSVALKSKADYICEPIFEGGIAKTLKKLHLID